jgi:hypothetical protein
MRLGAVFDDPYFGDTLSAEVYTLGQLRNIRKRLSTSPDLSDSALESLVPVQLQVPSANSGIGLQSATMYLALHAAFTETKPLNLKTVNVPTSRLFHIVANSASTFIDHFTRLNEGNKMISIFMASEKVLEAGMVWSTYLFSLQSSITAGYQSPFTISTQAMMSPVLKVSALLASFAARWTHGSEYVTAWETLVELLWNII